jgi:hypothetical protein
MAAQDKSKDTQPLLEVVEEDDEFEVSLMICLSSPRSHEVSPMKC